jgi:organic radical activating enzyme
MKSLDQVAQQVNQVSPSFCAAKWKQVTIHLQNGHTHSCHHPDTHLVPLSEIKMNPGALHNTQHKKELRKQMLEGVRPSECDYCWRVEDSGTNQHSDRIRKSATQWALPYIQDIVSKPWDDNVDPSYVEVSFSSVCNFKCSYCAPHISSKWMEEIEQYGEYPTSSKFNGLQWIKEVGKMPRPNREDNPYVEAFWKWWPTMYTSLQQFRITGGEPLLAKDTFKVLDYIIANPNPNLEVSINSNLCVPPELFDRFVDKLKNITENRLLKKIQVFTSCEAWGSGAEYIRHGMDYQQWLANVNRLFLEVPNIYVTVMSTYNLLSLPSYTRFLEDILAIKQANNRTHRSGNMWLDIPYLRYPTHQAVFIADPTMLHYIEESIQFMENNSNHHGERGFHPAEIDGLKRTRDVLLQCREDEYTTVNRRDFIIFVDEHDRRRGTSFLATFPEFEHTYRLWSQL